MSKGARIREQKRKDREMEETGKEIYERLEAFTADLDSQPDGPYYGCSYDLEHREDCDESCLVMSKMDIAIMHEEKRWQLAEMNPNNVKHDIFRLDVSLQTLIGFLIDEDIVDQDKLQAAFQDKLFTTLRDLREKFQPEVEEARREHLIVKQMPNGLLGPNGKPLH